MFLKQYTFYQLRASRKRKQEYFNSEKTLLPKIYYLRLFQILTVSISCVTFCENIVSI